MEIFHRLVCCYIALNVLSATIPVLTTSQTDSGGKDKALCSQTLFPHIRNLSTFKSNSFTECMCENRTQMICPNVSTKPLTVAYDTFRQELTFTGNNVQKFEVVIRHVGYYVKLVQPRSLHVTMCCRKSVLDDTSGNSRDLSTLYPNDIRSPETVRRLVLADNCFQKVAGKFTNTLVKLQEFNLANNYLTHFEPGTFSALGELQVLNLARNSIKTLSRSTFKGLISLRRLDIQSNDIEDLQEDVFKELVNLELLNLASNKLKTVPAEIFRNNDQLRGLSLEANELTTLPGTVLSPLEKLVFFSVFNNKLESVPQEIFTGLTDLGRVRLNQNRLKHVPPNLFSTNGVIAKIDLSSNSLREIPVLNFMLLSDEPRLSVSLRNNRIRSVALPLTRYISTYVKELDLSGNCIQHMEQQDTYKSTSDGGVSGIDGLVCRECCLSTVTPAFLENVIESADLSDNKIRKLDMGTLKSFANLKTVDLSNNLITTLNVSKSYPLIRDGNHKPYESLRARINLGRNPIICDCNLMPFLHVVKHNFTAHNHSENRSNMTFELKDVSCAQPPSLQNLKLWQFHRPKLAEKLICNIVTHCPEGCHCYFRAAPPANVVNCSNQNFHTFPSLEGMQQPMELHLENNSIAHLPLKKSSIWQKLSGLYLQNNQLRSLENFTATSNLKTLRLQYNLLTKFDTSLENLLSLPGTSVSLSHNPWECSCNLQKMKSMIVSTDGAVDDFSKIECTDHTNKSVILLANSTDYQLCPVPWHSQLLLKVLLSTASAVVVIVSLVSVLFFRYKDQLYLWLFKNGYCLGLVTEEDVDCTKLFDAFVSCSNKDDKWVASYLLPELEEGTPAYSLCIHSRNWPVGGWIPDMIIKSVQKSRRTIIILTKNFLESHWSRLEFRTAYEQALTEPAVNRVLIIVPYEVPEVLDPILSGFIKLNTYIKWGDPHFWRKLRCAMPRIKPHVRKNALSIYQLNSDFVMLPKYGKDQSVLSI